MKNSPLSELFTSDYRNNLLNIIMLAVASYIGERLFFTCKMGKNKAL